MSLVWSRLLLAGALVWLGGCTTSPVTDLLPPVDQPRVVQALSGQPLALEGPPPAMTAPGELMVLTDAMRAFADEAVAGHRGDAARTRALHGALVLSENGGGRGIAYDAGATLTPREVFDQRRANCLSFSLMFVAMARHVGLEAAVNDVEVPPTWNRNGDQVQFMRHVNARVDLSYSTDDIVVDLDLQNFREHYPQRLIGDETAKAQYYNNLAVSARLAQRDPLESFYYLKQALALDPTRSYLWNNLASLYRYRGHPRIAEALYRQALEHNPSDLTVIHNLGRLYERQGRVALAGELERIARDYRQQNPYYQYRQAEALSGEQRYREAASHIERAIHKRPDEPLFQRLAVTIYGQLGNSQRQTRARERLESLQQGRFSGIL